jgi:hypothetical protein
MSEFYRPIDYPESDFNLSREWLLDYAYGPDGVKVTLSNILTDGPAGGIVRVVPWRDMGQLFAHIAAMIPAGATRRAPGPTSAERYGAPHCSQQVVQELASTSP